MQFLECVRNPRGLLPRLKWEQKPLIPRWMNGFRFVLVHGIHKCLKKIWKLLLIYFVILSPLIPRELHTLNPHQASQRRRIKKD